MAKGSFMKASYILNWAFYVSDFGWDHIPYMRIAWGKLKDHCIFATSGDYVLSTGSRMGRGDLYNVI